MRFVHLHVHSHYSLLDGLAKVDDLVNQAVEYKMDSLALTDHGNLYGAIEFYKKAKKANLKPILGMEAYLAPKSRFDKEYGDRYYHLTLLSKNETGWKNLIQLSTKAYLEGFYYKPRIDKELLRIHHEGLIALSGCISGEINSLILENKPEEAKKKALEYMEIFGPENFYLEIGYHPNIAETLKIKNEVPKLAKELGLKFVATYDIHYQNSKDAEYHDILLAIQTGNKLSDDDRLTLKADDFSLASQEKMVELFKDLPEALETSGEIADKCSLNIELNKIHLPEFPKPEGETADSYLKKLIEQNIDKKFKKEEQNAELTNRLDYELSIIQKTGFADYFLIVQDLVNWAKNHGIAVGPGRGSAAGSLVSYILNITDVDPLKYDLLFERFLNPDRIQMPDIDIDFADNRRDEVLAYVQSKYGSDRVARIITFGTMASRAAVRDAGRAMGLSYGFCDQVAKLIPPHLNLEMAVKDVAELNQIYNSNPDAKRLLEAAKHLEGVARHASVHACGTVISKEPLTNYVPLQFAPQNKDTIITQFEMHTIEDLGLLKMDFLGLRNLTIIENTINLIKKTKGITIDISKIPLDDKKTFELLQKGDTTGIFQLEGSGMRHYLKELGPTEIEDITVMISLYRPGTLDAGMVPLYIARKHGKEPITYPHPKLEPILKNTYGVMVYQEQLIGVARNLAGFTFAEADTLRKAVGKKIKSLLDEQAEKFIKGAIKNGIDPKTARKIWEWFEPFARYGFNRSHATSYALIAYETAYLKTHYLIEFMVGLFNAELQDIDQIAFLIKEAQTHKIDILPPDINKSFYNFAPEEQNIRFGLVAIKNIGDKIAEAVIEERMRGGEFKSLEDLLSRVQHKDLNKKSLESLIKSGALDSLKIERNQGLQNIDEILKFSGQMKKGKSFSGSLFGSAYAPAGKLVLKPAPEATANQKLAWEKELIGLYLSGHPLNAYAEKIKSLGVMPIEKIKKLKNNSLAKTAGSILKVKNILTKNSQSMLFVEIEDATDSIEVIVFNNVLKKTYPIWQENKIVAVKGRISVRNGEPKLICEEALSLG